MKFSLNVKNFGDRKEEIFKVFENKKVENKKVKLSKKDVQKLEDIEFLMLLNALEAKTTQFETTCESLDESYVEWREICEWYTAHKEVLKIVKENLVKREKALEDQRKFDVELKKWEKNVASGKAFIEFVKDLDASEKTDATLAEYLAGAEDRKAQVSLVDIISAKPQFDTFKNSSDDELRKKILNKYNDFINNYVSAYEKYAESIGIGQYVSKKKGKGKSFLVTEDIEKEWRAVGPGTELPFPNLPSVTLPDEYRTNLRSNKSGGNIEDISQNVKRARHKYYEIMTNFKFGKYRNYKNFEQFQVQTVALKPTYDFLILLKDCDYPDCNPPGTSQAIFHLLG